MPKRILKKIKSRGFCSKRTTMISLITAFSNAVQWVVGQVQDSFMSIFGQEGERQQQQEQQQQRIFEVVRTFSNSNRKFTSYFDTYKVYVYGRVDPVAVFKKALDLTVEERQLVPVDKIRVIVSHPSWTKPFSTKLIMVTDDEQFFYTLLKTILEYVEYKSVPLDEVKIEVQSAKIPRGLGRLTVTKHNIGIKRALLPLKTPIRCVLRAIVTAHANINKTKWRKSQIKNGFNDSRKLLGIEAVKLHEDSGVPITDYGNTLEDVKNFAQHLGIQINIVDADYFEIIFTANIDAVEIIYIYKSKNHYDVITSMPAFLGKKNITAIRAKKVTRNVTNTVVL